MKRWWIGYTGKDGGVCEVEVIGQRNPEASWGMIVVRLSDGLIEDVGTSDLHETVTEARRGRALSEAEDLEVEAKNREASAEYFQGEAERALAEAGAYRAKATELHARAKALRDALEEVNGATEGRE